VAHRASVIDHLKPITRGDFLLMPIAFIIIIAVSDQPTAPVFNLAAFEDP
jgi:hypothetical protein